MEDNFIKVQAEIVNGKCPTCTEYTMLVGVSHDYYRCMNCGSDLQQFVNGKISYLPVLASHADYKPFVKDWK
jgi:transposase-like protein|tara:strand:+ start:45 stop:260 length:216 start_codon:yes stop_codon:yes gene_type:complete